MSKQCYIPKKFHLGTERLIDTMNDIVEDYVEQGYVLTVRQLYYQLVARDIIANNLQEYKRVASIINDAKLAGLMDWAAIEDRTREFIVRNRWSSGGSILNAVANQFHMDMWVGQEMRVFVIVEKEALVGVLEGTCRQYDIPLLAARGYPSGSVLREFAKTHMKDATREGQGFVILHLGDHDPSGIDMSRDLQERLTMFNERYVSLDRIALNMDQVEEQQPPENPAKNTDSRYQQYRQDFGSSCWELDALSPAYLNQLLKERIEPYIDYEVWSKREDEIEDVKERLRKIANEFDDHR